MVKTSCVTAWVIRSTNMLAPAMPPGVPLRVSRRAPMRSPPTCATGRSVLMPSRTKRSEMQSRRVGPAPRGNTAYQPRPAQATAAKRASTTASVPQPALTTAAVTSDTPEDRNSASAVPNPTIDASVVRRFISLFRSSAKACVVEIPPEATIEA